MDLQFDQRFLEQYAGTKILKDPRTAIVELVANSWDAGATNVDITWPNSDADRAFSITDNGIGLTPDEFSKRWWTIAYDRRQDLGPNAVFPPDVNLSKRQAFGKNGRGRFAGFCFGTDYFVSTKKNGIENVFKVSKGVDKPLDLEFISSQEAHGHGTKVYVVQPNPIQLTPEEARQEIGMRFLFDPDFTVNLDGSQINFSDIPHTNLAKKTFTVKGVGEVTVVVIDTQNTDRTTYQHGVAWQVKGRSVGKCSWKGRYEHLVDGRRIEARRLTFIVYADCLEDAVLPDWSGFDPTSEAVEAVYEAVGEFIKEFLYGFSKSRIDETFREIKTANADTLRRLGPAGRENWKRFVSSVQKDCPSISEKDLKKLADLMASLEESKSRYALLHRLGELNPDQIDDLQEILRDWTVDIAKAVLDEIKTRMLLLNELEKKINDPDTDEVQELQPLFERGLWIFGPEYETIEFTSNKGMTTVIQKLFNGKSKGSLKRPDFAILPDGTVGLYSYYRFDDEGAEVDVARLTIVELKRPGVEIGEDEISQCYKYIVELMRKGYITKTTKVTGFIVGEEVDQFHAAKQERGDFITLQPLLFETIIKRAKSRLLKLYDTVRDVPFLNSKELEDYLSDDIIVDGEDGSQTNLPLSKC